MTLKKNISTVFFIFLCSHLFIWTVVPSVSNINLPLDTIEALAWGSNLDWGFNKHPPLSAFVVETFYFFFGSQDWAFYLLSQIFVIIAFYIVFKFSLEFFKNEKIALLSVLLLEGIYFYNFTTPEFNVNICQLPFWSLSIYYSWRCIKFDKTRDFIFLGLFIGLGILSKYLFIYLVIGIKFYFLHLIKKRKKININYFIPGFLALLITTPHIIWLIENNYETIKYGLQRTGESKLFIDHLIYPVIFLIKQIGILIPFIIMLLLIIKKNKFKINLKDEKFIFLFFTIVFPIILILFTSMIMGAKIRTMWMTPFYLFFGVLVLFIFQKKVNLKKIKKFYFSLLFFFFISPVIYFIISFYNDNKRTDYPGEEIARLVQNKWDQNFRNEIKYVIGDEWYAGNLSYHLVSRPVWMLSLKKNNFAIDQSKGVIYTGNPEVLKKVCPGVFGTIKPVGYCMIGLN